MASIPHALVTVLTLAGQSVLPWLTAMHQQCAKQLRPYPYLYAPLQEQCVNPSDTIYINDPEAMVAIVQKQEAVVGIAAGLPLSSPFLAAHYFSPELVGLFRAKGWDPEKIWYMGYFLMSSEFQEDAERIQSVYKLFREKALSAGKTQLCYVDVLVEGGHPLKPVQYRHPEPWETMIGGFFNSEVEIESIWPTIQADGSVKDAPHRIRFYLKDLL